MRLVKKGTEAHSHSPKLGKLGVRPVKRGIRARSQHPKVGKTTVRLVIRGLDRAPIPDW